MVGLLNRMQVDLITRGFSVDTRLIHNQKISQTPEGSIKNDDNSGYHHVTASVDPTRYFRQARMFHPMQGFKLNS